jgi:uncharacterized protein
MQRPPRRTQRVLGWRCVARGMGRHPHRATGESSCRFYYVFRIGIIAIVQTPTRAHLLERQPDVREGRVGGIGLSVGGEQLIETAASDSRLKAVVSEGAGERSVRESLVRGVRGWPAVPSMAVQTAALAVLSGRTPPPPLRDLVARIAPRPVFFIYAEDGGGGEELTPEYYAAARQPKQQWLVPGAGHTGGLSASPAEYERRIVKFFDQALLRP